MVSQLNILLQLRLNVRVVLLPSPHHFRDRKRRLPALEARRHLSVRMLTFLTPSGCLALAGSWTTTASDLLMVCAWVIGQRREDGRRALMGGDEGRYYPSGGRAGR
jgi:hypothetical protein